MDNNPFNSYSLKFGGDALMTCTRFDLVITVVMVISTFSINFLAKLLCIYLFNVGAHGG